MVEERCVEFRDHCGESFDNVIFDCKVFWMVVEGEWNSVGFFAL